MKQSPFETGALQMSEDLEGRVLELYKKTLIGLVNFPNSTSFASILAFPVILESEHPRHVLGQAQNIPLSALEEMAKRANEIHKGYQIHSETSGTRQEMYEVTTEDVLENVEPMPQRFNELWNSFDVTKESLGELTTFFESVTKAFKDPAVRKAFSDYKSAFIGKTGPEALGEGIPLGQHAGKVFIETIKSYRVEEKYLEILQTYLYSLLFLQES